MLFAVYADTKRVIHAHYSTDPALDSLKDNGGPTETMALTLASPAVNAGDDTTCAAPPVNNLDQRGLTRSSNGPHCDIGAYEYQDSTASTVTAFTATSPSTSLNIPITAFTASDSMGVTGYKITTSSTEPLASASGWTASAPQPTPSAAMAVTPFIPGPKTRRATTQPSMARPPASVWIPPCRRSSPACAPEPAPPRLRAWIAS